jgi:hypothetical protein
MYQEEMIYYRGLSEYVGDILPNISYINNISTAVNGIDKIDDAAVNGIDKIDDAAVNGIDKMCIFNIKTTTEDTFDLASDDSDFDPMDDYIIFGTHK